MSARILLIDSYDSFTYNLAALCKRAVSGAEVHIIKNDALPFTHLVPLLAHFNAVVVGPGPGSPEIPGDVGVVRDLWHAADEDLIPVFGVCLGLQSLAVEHGAEIKRLNVVKHGQVSTIYHTGADIFTDVGDIRAVRYHSLYAHLPEHTNLVPLAYADDGEENGRVLMALKHATKPFWGVQYHPESVCSERGGVELIQNFWKLSLDWARTARRTSSPWTPAAEASLGSSWPSLRPPCSPSTLTPSTPVITRSLTASRIDIPRICEALGVEDDSLDFVMLDSPAAPGRFSIIGCLRPTSPRITFSVGDSTVRLQRGPEVTHIPLDSADIWTWLSAFMGTRRAHGGIPDIPFWGGLVGYLSYELGAETLSSLPPRPDTRHPDVNLVFVERSIVVDAHSGSTYVQSILPTDQAWLDEMLSQLQALNSLSTEPSFETPLKTTPVRKDPSVPVVTLPERNSYISKVVSAKEWLFSGDSYELCVTAPTRVVAPKAPSTIARGTASSWALYKLLRSRNPAPHSGYLRLRPSTLLSSSPERFLSYARPPDGVCQLRPIKGTVRKAPGITREVAEEMLSGSKKEVAENLMIVDLIRHDLHGVVGEDVEVKQFCTVEEYETVWQLVSVIEGRPDASMQGRPGLDLGWDVLKNSLPPGSMTGAPKKRSVEILRQLEGAERGVYSGVLGYADVGGGGDWAVTIRSCFKYDENPSPPKTHRQGFPTPLPSLSSDTREHSSLTPRASTDTNFTDEWTLGAGGAITALSDPVAEWEEMITKVESVLRAFGDLSSC